MKQGLFSFYRQVSFSHSQSGITLVEIIITLTVIFILASIALPISKITIKRGKELELRRSLREMRVAIDRFRWDYEAKKISRLESDVVNSESGYPVSLDILVEGAPSGDVKGTLRKYLRRIPKDPMTGEREWGLRCYKDPPDETEWCGDDVFDVFTLSEGVGLDGVHYREW
ncbi:MAG TPA: prepilin-type N-terminal cleavage/methylation domain-containing protein [Nitrospiria bacterium]|jgi:general secretion pathway protein G